jgi:hypothetical protein
MFIHVIISLRVVFLFFQCCDIEKFAKFSKTLVKIVEFRGKNRNFQQLPHFFIETMKTMLEKIITGDHRKCHFC